MIDVNVAEHIVLHLVTCGKVIFMLNVLSILTVPVLNLGGNFRVYVAVLIYIVDTLIQVDDDVEQQVYALASLKHSRNHWHTK